MRSLASERQAKEYNRRIHRTFAYISLPLSEWWHDMPLYPNASPQPERIRITEYFDGDLAREEVVGLYTHDPIEIVANWYLAAMPTYEWVLDSAKSRVEQKSDSDFVWIEFEKDDGLLGASISVGEVGKEWTFLEGIGDKNDQSHRVAEAIQQVTNNLNQTVLDQTGAGIKRILLVFKERRSQA